MFVIGGILLCPQDEEDTKSGSEIKRKTPKSDVITAGVLLKNILPTSLLTGGIIIYHGRH